MLILAGVTITALLGDDGIIKKAQNVADSTNSAIQNELSGMNSLTDKMNSILNGNCSKSSVSSSNHHVEKCKNLANDFCCKM